jgi:hypothetical protein
MFQSICYVGIGRMEISYHDSVSEALAHAKYMVSMSVSRYQQSYAVLGGGVWNPLDDSITRDMVLFYESEL